MKKPKKDKFSKASVVSPFENSLNEYETIQSDADDSDGLLDNLAEESEESSEEEVLPIHSGSDAESSEDDLEDDGASDVDDDDDDEENENDNISDSDIDQPDLDLPDSKAWGKRKRLFYNADHINDRSDYLNEEDEAAAKMEEEEGKIIQKRLISEIDNADLSLDLLSDVIAEQKEENDIFQREKILIDLSQMNQQEKMKLLKKESPEFLTSVENYQRFMKLMQDDLVPVMKLLKPSQLQNSTAGKFVKMYSQLIMNYCTNLSFYVLLKSRRADSPSHPIHDWLPRYEQLFREVEPVYETQIKPQVESILRGELNIESGGRKKRKKKSISTTNTNNEATLADHENFNHNKFSSHNNQYMSINKNLDFDDDTEDADGKRPITYQIAKNKGLTPHRKKELRNPRVKHRMKYRKAKIRRKGQVREVRRELQKYGGEISGIKASVVKSVKLKN